MSDQQKSLLSQANESNFQLPSSIANAEISVISTETFDQIPFVVFAQPKSVDVWAKLVAVNPQVQEGEIYLLRPNPYPPLRLPDFRFTLIHAKQMWAIENPQGKATKISYEDQEKDPAYCEVNETVVLVHLDAIVPARCVFKRTKADAFRTCMQALATCQKPEWATFSEAHAMTVSIQDPRFRFVTKVGVTKGTGKKTGLPFYAADGTIIPTDMVVFKKICDFFTDPTCDKQLQAVLDSYKWRLGEMDKLTN